MQELSGLGAEAPAASATIELHAMELEGYGPFRQASDMCPFTIAAVQPRESSLHDFKTCQTYIA